MANIGLDYLFMGAMHLGPIGAALGTTLSQAVSVVVALVVILRQKAGITPAHADLKPRCAVMGELLRIGVPIALQDGLIQVAFIIITIIANRRGLNDAAAVGIVEKIISFLFLVPSSMLSTVYNFCTAEPIKSPAQPLCPAVISCTAEQSERISLAWDTF